MSNQTKYRVRNALADGLVSVGTPELDLHDAATTAAERTGRSYEDVRSSIALLTEQLPATMLPARPYVGNAVRVEIVQ